MISFIIPLFNHLAETREMLASLQATVPAGMNYEIILADDASTDGAPAWLRTLRDPRIKVLLSEQNRGYAANNNAGVKLAEGEVLGLLNNDLLFAPGWLEPMLDVLLARQGNAGLVGNVQFRVADGALDHAGVFLDTDAQFKHLRTLDAGESACRRVLAVTGACMLVRKADFDAVGGFDERYVNGCEDMDLCFKLRRLGKAVFVATDSRIRHHVSLSRKTQTLQDLRNSRLLFARWRGEIKQELTAIWLPLVRGGPAAYADRVSGQLAADFVATPHLASRVIAEAVLQREEAFWARQLGRAPQACWAGRVGTRGLRHAAHLDGHLLANQAEFVVQEAAYVQNFYVCGRRMADASQPGTLTIHVNDLQTVTMPIGPERHVNAGIPHPLLLPGAVNRFRLESTEPLLLTHWVLDDQVLDF